MICFHQDCRNGPNGELSFASNIQMIQLKGPHGAHANFMTPSLSAHLRLPSVVSHGSFEKSYKVPIFFKSIVTTPPSIMFVLVRNVQMLSFLVRNTFGTIYVRRI